MAKKYKEINASEQKANEVPQKALQDPICAYTPPAVLELQFTNTISLNGKFVDKIICFDWNITECPSGYRVSLKDDVHIDSNSAVANFYVIPRSICIALMMEVRSDEKNRTNCS